MVCRCTATRRSSLARGIELSRQTLSGWLVQLVTPLAPVMAALKRHLTRGPVLQVDEPPVQVLDEPGRANTTKSYMWVYRGGPPDRPVVWFQYASPRTISKSRLRTCKPQSLGCPDAYGLPDPNVVLVPLNAVYFLGEWTEQFDPDDTRDAPFTLADGDTVEVATMHRDDDELEVELSQRDDHQIMRLPYGEDERFGTEIVLPDESHDLDGFAGTEATAATGGVMVESEPPALRIDRPFAFTVSDRETGAILFLGTVHDPRG